MKPIRTSQNVVCHYANDETTRFLTAEEAIQLLFGQTRRELRGAEGVRREIGVQELCAQVAVSAREEDPGEVLEGSYHASHLSAAGERGARGNNPKPLIASGIAVRHLVAAVQA